MSATTRAWLLSDTPRSRLQSRLGQLYLRWLTFRSNPLAVVGLAIVVLLLLAALFAPIIATHDPIRQALDQRLLPPSAAHFFGTDALGRDIFSRVVHGARVTLMVVVLVVVTVGPLGLLVGATAGYAGGWVDDLLMRITDIFLTVPALVLAIAVTAALGKGMINVMIGISLVWWPGFARLTRSLVLGLREEAFVEAARSIGVSHRRILFQHILPNTLSPIIVKMSTDFGFAVLTAAALGFIGLGAQPPTPEWGAMINDGRDYFPDKWWVSTFPGMAIFLMVFSWNLLGDGVRDLLDPRAK